MSKNQLDISILSADKYLISTEKIKDLLTRSVLIEHKTDGVKLTVIKITNYGKLEDYIFAYKGNIIYYNEFEHLSDDDIKSYSISNSQFKLVLNHFRELPKNSIPVGTELFIEFLMKKPTLSSNYNINHKMILIGYSESTFKIEFGKLKTKNSGMQEDKRNIYAKELKIDVPQLLFSGVLGSLQGFENGILHEMLQREYQLVKQTFNWDNPENLINSLKNLFLSVESKYGNLEEGVVIKSGDLILKWQQSYQNDQDSRNKIKNAFRENNYVDESQYWKNVQETAIKIANNIEVSDISNMLNELSTNMKSLVLDFKHTNKTRFQIMDDIHGSVKILLIKRMRGNNNALYFGKFRVLTNAHYNIIKRAFKLYDNVVVGLITSKDTSKTKDLRKEMLLKAFPGLTIIENSTGNINTLLSKSPKNINAVLAGSDRVRAYQEQTSSQLGLIVKEIPRTGDDISASKIIENIYNEEYFKDNTPKEIHSLYNKIKNHTNDY